MTKQPNSIYQFLSNRAGLLLFAISLLIAIFSFSEYGMSWDEEIQHETGLKSYEYVFEGNPGLLDWRDKDYGVAFEMPLVMLEKLFGIEDFRTIFLFRHFVTHLFFLFGAFTFFKLVDLLFDSKLLAAIGFLLIVLHPRLYSHSFFNTKDIPFLTMYIIAMYQAALFFKKQTIKRVLFLGASVGLLTNFRIMGAMLFLMILFFIVVDAFVDKKPKEKLLLGFAFIVSSLLVLYASWPYLWPDPINNFVIAFENMSKFRWGGDVRFAGEKIRATELPWTYIPVWFSITTPLIYVVVGIIGMLLILIRFIKDIKLFFVDKLKRNNLIYLAVFIAPILLVIVLHSVLYDSWRQLFFIYPAFAMLVVYALNEWMLYSKKTLVLVFSLVFGYVGFFMFKYYPNQYVYFNQLTSFVPTGKQEIPFELDYWGVSYKQSLEYLLRTDDRAQIKVYMSLWPGKTNVHFLPQGAKDRIQVVDDVQEADYFCYAFREFAESIDTQRIYSIEVSGRVIQEIFKLKKED